MELTVHVCYVIQSSKFDKMLQSACCYYFTGRILHVMCYIYIHLYTYYTEWISFRQVLDIKGQAKKCKNQSNVNQKTLQTSFDGTPCMSYTS